MTDGRDELILTSTSRRLRRAVGPTAWVVLEALTADAVPDGDGLVVVTSVRRLADTLGLGRDAVASAVQALAFAGQLTVESTRDGAGRFASTRYVVAATDALRRADSAGDAPRRAMPGRRQSAPRREQLSLLDTAAATSARP